MAWKSSLFACLLGMLICFVESIIDGDKVKFDEILPYQVSINRIHENHSCGGGIIDDYFILTAAHCVMHDGRIETMRRFVLVGTNDLYKLKTPAFKVEVAKIYVPLEYEPKVRSTGDIAVLKLKKSLDLKNSRYLSKLKLANIDGDFARANATIAGFGWDYIRLVENEEGQYEEIGGYTDSRLRWAHATVLRPHDFGYHSENNEVKQISARIHQRGPINARGTCTGDSGGPLVLNETIVIGVFSMSPFACSEMNDSSTYTRVSHYYGFIRHAMADKKSHDILAHPLV